ncbi:3'-5' exonuclease [Candidatus Pacearchaeota archaeon]|nr:3'-5' exonuclease [Candidatus Pacearchaeota archaeon]
MSIKSNIMPIVLDIETSGLDRVKCGIWQIGAIDLNTMEEFLEESRIDDDDFIEKDALVIIGKTEDELRDEEKISQQELLKNFFKWMAGRAMRNVLCQNPQFDISIIEIRAKKYGLKKPIQHRAFDLHSIAQAMHLKINDEFLIRPGKDTDGFESNMNLTNILNFCGLPDKRTQIVDGKIVQKGNAHNALEDCKLTAECFSRLLYGKNMFEEYSKYEVPEELKR